MRRCSFAVLRDDVYAWAFSEFNETPNFLFRFLHVCLTHAVSLREYALQGRVEGKDAVACGHGPNRRLATERGLNAWRQRERPAAMTGDERRVAPGTEGPVLPI